MNNKILVILLSLTLSYTANANNEIVQDTESIGYDRVQLREQIATAWQNTPPVTADQITCPINTCPLSESNNESHQNKYIVISFNPGFFHTPPPNFNTVGSLAEMDGVLPLQTELAQDIEAGLGIKRGSLRFEVGGRWIRFHMSDPRITHIEFPDIFWGDVDVVVSQSHFHDNPILAEFDALDRFSYGQSIDNFGVVGGVAYDIKIAGEDVFYVGGKVGLLRASLGHIINDTNDFTTLYQLDVGVTKEVARNLAIQLGLQYSKTDETNFNHINDVLDASVGPVSRYSARLAFLFSVGE